MPAETFQEREKRIAKLWKSLDTADNGQLDVKGLKKGLKKLDHPLKNADALLHDVLKVVDTSGSGSIQYNEFKVFIEHAERELFQLFDSIDKDHSGSLDKDELRTAFARSGVVVSNAKIDRFFDEIDTNHDGEISFEEWRDFLLFVPHGTPSLRTILTYYSATGNVNQEGDVHLNDTLQGLDEPDEHSRAGEDEDTLSLTEFLPVPGYFAAGGLAGMISRTATAPLDRLKVYLIAKVSPKDTMDKALKEGKPLSAIAGFTKNLADACKELWRAGGIRSLFAGNGLNVLKVMPESAIKFGAYEAAKKTLANLEGSDPKHLHPTTQFLAGGFGGAVAQIVSYPLDTLKFRMQCETVEGGLRGNKLIAQTAKTMWREGKLWPYYRGLGMGLAGMFPYSAIDLFIFEGCKRYILGKKAKALGVHEEDVEMGNLVTGAIGATSGAVSATAVYPINLLRTRLQAQGTVMHPPTYTGIADVTRKTIQNEGWRGLFKGVTPNLLKVAPAVSISYVVYENSKTVLGLN